MGEHKIVPQREFNSLKDFTDNNNNYWSYWMDYERGMRMRKTPPFQRFIKKYPKFSEWLIKETTEGRSRTRYLSEEVQRNLPQGMDLPWEALWASYKRLAKLVYEEDFNGRITGCYKADKDHFLCG